MDEIEKYVPCPEGSWRDHVVQLVDMLRPIIDEEMDPTDRVILIDNLYEEMCDWHLLAMLYLFTGFASGLSIGSAELYEASKSLQERDPQTLGTPHP